VAPRKPFPLETLAKLRGRRTDARVQEARLRAGELESAARRRANCEAERDQQTRDASAATALEADRFLSASASAADLQRLEAWQLAQRERAARLELASREASHAEAASREALERARRGVATAKAEHSAVERRRERFETRARDELEREQEQDALEAHRAGRAGGAR
jgi:hypothetical protein